MPTMQRFEIASDLLAPAADVWPGLLDMASINAELAPIRMTVPRGANLPGMAGSQSLHSIDLSQVPLGQVLFQSWVLLWGVIPLDRHALCLTEIIPGEGFHEESHSWIERRWIHDRRLTRLTEGCRITDRIGFEPRLPIMAPLLAPIIHSTFERRHRRLRARYGTPDPTAAPRVTVVP
jgi:hypothetical protein